MRLYMIERASTVSSPMFYWAENENDAINEHRRQTGTDAELIASAIWANNEDARHRGFVIWGE